MGPFIAPPCTNPRGQPGVCGYLRPSVLSCKCTHLSQEYSSPNHNYNLGLVEPLVLSCSILSEPSDSGSKAASPHSIPTSGKISMVTRLAAGLENGSILKQACHRFPLLLLHFSNCSNTNTYIILCLWSIFKVLKWLSSSIYSNFVVAFWESWFAHLLTLPHLEVPPSSINIWIMSDQTLCYLSSTLPHYWDSPIKNYQLPPRQSNRLWVKQTSAEF